MKYILIIILLVGSGIGCKKTDNPTPATEAAIAFTIDASANTIATGSTYPVIVTLTSAMPSTKGISIEVTVTDQTNNASLTQNPTAISTNISNTVNLINLQRQHWCTANVKVSSVATPSNTASKSFNIVYK